MKAAPDPPADDAPEGCEAYTRWKKADEMARYYILASMLNVLQSFTTFEYMIFNPNEMFGSQGCSARQSAMQMILNTKMSEGTPVREHMLK